MIDVGIFHLLSATAAITSLCEGRIYPTILPPGPTLPALTYRMISAKPSPTLTTSGFQRWRMQCDCFAETEAQAVGLREALRSTLEGYNGVLSDGTFLQDAQFVQLSDSFQDDASLHLICGTLLATFAFSS
jgi:hypothetical protein